MITAPIDSLIPYARNARTHSDGQIAQIAASIVEFGFTNPILIDDQGVIAGHGRLAAARLLYQSGKTLGLPGGDKLAAGAVPVIDCTGWSDAKRRAYILADNKLAMNAGWDEDMLRLELSDLTNDGFDLSLIGFGDDELAALMVEQTEGLTDPDETPPVPDEPVSVLGDVWVLGRHRLVCGDCTEVGVVDKALNGVKPHLMVTDPPYGVEYDPKWRARAGVNKSDKKMGAVENDGRSDWRESWSLFPGDVAYIWHGGSHASAVQDSLEAAAFTVRCQIIWAKDRFALSRGDYHWQHEPCWYAVREKATGHWNGDRKQSTLWSIKAREDSGHGHSTQKPVECMKRPIENNSSPGQAVYEPFSGSGTTIIAAEMTGRACHAIELSPAYVDVAVKRWQAFTGKAAICENTGATFSEVENARRTPPIPAH